MEQIELVIRLPKDEYEWVKRLNDSEIGRHSGYRYDTFIFAIKNGMRKEEIDNDDVVVESENYAKDYAEEKIDDYFYGHDGNSPEGFWS